MRFDIVSAVLHLTSIQTTASSANRTMQAIQNLFKNDLVLVGTNLTVVAGVATYLGITPSFMFPSTMKSSSFDSNI